MCVCVYRLCVIPCTSDISGWIFAGDGFCNSLPSVSNTNMKTAIVIDCLSYLVFSLSVNHVCQLLNRLCRHAKSRFFSNSVPVTGCFKSLQKTVDANYADAEEIWSC